MTVTPRWVTDTDTTYSDGPYVADFIEQFCRITKTTIAGNVGEPLVLQDWQRNLLSGLYARTPEGKRKHRQALIGIPRKNGKSALGAGLGLYGLVAEDEGAEVYSVAGDREQARIVFSMAKRMVELDEELSEVCSLYRDAIEVKSTGSYYKVLSSDAPLKEGLSPTKVIFDELHVQPNDELWNVMSLGTGARLEPLVIGITTAGVKTQSDGQDTICYRLYQYGKRVAAGEIDDPSFFFAWWEPQLGVDCDHTDPQVWAESNPGLGTIVSVESFESDVRRTPENEFRTKRTNVFTSAKEAALPHGAWDACADPNRPIDPTAETIVFGFDGSFSGDSTGLVGCVAGEIPHLFVIDAWEKPVDADQHWRVSIKDVELSIVAAAEHYKPREVACDPFRWQHTMAELEEQHGLTVVEWRTNQIPRMVPAWKNFYDAIVDGRLTHDGDPRLARHLENMVIRTDQSGARPTKESKNSNRKIDLGIAAIIAFDCATHLEPSVSVTDLVW